MHSKDLLHQRIETSGRLVEDQELYVAGERRDQRHLLPIASGVRRTFLCRIKLKPFQHFIAAYRVDAAAQPAEQVDHLTAGELRPQVDLARNVCQPAMQCGCVGPRIAAEQADGPGRGAQESEQDTDGCRLPSTVWAEEAVDLSLCDAEIQTVEGTGPSEVLHQPSHADHIRHAA